MMAAADADRLFRDGKPVLEMVAKRLARRIGRSVDLDDLVSLGRPALLEAAQTFDPDRAKFSTYASLKIKWAILDGLRRETGGRSLTGRAMALALSERFGEGFAANEQEAAETASVDELPTEEVYSKRLRALLDGHAAALAAGLAVSAAREALTPEPVETPEESMLRADLAATLREEVARLPERERTLVERHYFGGEDFDEIAKELGISKSWASRLHAQAVSRLGAALRGDRSRS